MSLSERLREYLEQIDALEAEDDKLDSDVRRIRERKGAIAKERDKIELARYRAVIASNLNEADEKTANEFRAEQEAKGSCAGFDGAKIKRMSSISEILRTGYTQFADQCEDAEGRMRNNIGCVVFAQMSVEARVLELIAVRSEVENDVFGVPQTAWAMVHKKRWMALKDRWNWTATLSEGTLWDEKKEPFKAFHEIVQLRNAVVHHKPTFEEHYDKRKGVMEIWMNKLGIKRLTSGSYVEIPGDSAYTLVDLLQEKELGSRIASDADSFHERLHGLLFGGKF